MIKASIYHMQPYSIDVVGVRDNLAPGVRVTVNLTQEAYDRLQGHELLRVEIASEEPEVDISFSPLQRRRAARDRRQNEKEQAREFVETIRAIKDRQ